MKRVSIALGLGLLVTAAVVRLSALRGPSRDALLGLWIENEARAPADPLHLYYFHQDGQGLYRYGQLAYNQTHSFDWHLDGDRLALRFRKTGERAVTRVIVGEENGRRTLRLEQDPRSPKPTRYRYVPANLDTTGPLSLGTVSDRLGSAPPQGQLAGRMWIDHKKFATGGMGFSLYQLSAHPSQPGWRIGWHHRGDFDDWSTERLDYRFDERVLRLRYTLRNEDQATPFRVDQDAGARRPRLTLEHDPRNFQAPGVFLDAGASF